MFTSMQPSRPQVQHQQARNPLRQQQTRAIHTDARKPELVTIPRNQIEAMPPHQTSPHTPAPLPMYNSAMTHPVFMMNQWRKTPFPLPINPAISPVAAGYVFPQVRSNMSTKL